MMKHLEIDMERLPDCALEIAKTWQGPGMYKIQWHTAYTMSYNPSFPVPDIEALMFANIENLRAYTFQVILDSDYDRYMFVEFLTNEKDDVAGFLKLPRHSRREIQNLATPNMSVAAMLKVLGFTPTCDYPVSVQRDLRTIWEHYIDFFISASPCSYVYDAFKQHLIDNGIETDIEAVMAGVPAKDIIISL